MAKRGRKPKVWAEDFKEQQQILLNKHAAGIPLTHEEITYLIRKDGKMPTCREEMMTKMSICKIEATAMIHLRQALLKQFPNFTENQLKDVMLEMLNKRTCARETRIPERNGYTYSS